ncbi:MAG: acyl--CoA ligase [Verrucomicrobiaceae bacterium]|nr:acyl--CoA ligase [Verrucomicrobiaceae bacterium]
MMNIVDLIFERHHGPEMAVISPDGSLSYAGLHARVLETEHALRRDASWPTHAKRPRIGLHAPSGPDYIVLALAILKAGACFVPIPSELTASEQAELIQRTSLHAVLRAKNADDWQLEAVEPSEETHAKAQRRKGSQRLSDLCAFAPLRETHLDSMSLEVPEAFDSLNAAFIRFSSGTTARSKGVVISHETLIARITAANEALRIGTADRVLWVLPMAHHFAVSIILYLYHGSTTILAPASDPAVMLRLMREHGATVMYGSPYHYTLLASQPDAAAMRQLRLAVSTAFALSQEVADLFHSKTGLHLTQGMGIIEAGLPLLNLEHAATRPTSVGKPTPSFEVKLDEGELLLRGPGLFDAYLSPWQPRDEVLRDGWFPTGDIAEIDDTGSLFLKGRVRSVINVGGMKCFPEEVEAILTSHPSVKAARVLARPHAALGFVPVAEVIAETGTESTLAAELKKLCQQRLSAYKVPLLFTFVSELPLTASGKVRRY